MKRVFVAFFILTLLIMLVACSRMESNGETPTTQDAVQSTAALLQSETGATTAPTTEPTTGPTTEPTIEPTTQLPEPDPEVTANLEYPEVPTDTDAQEYLRAVALRHITKYCYATLLYTQEDLTEHTIAELTQEQRDTINLSDIPFTVFYGEPPEDHMIPNYPEFVTQRAEYLSFYRENSHTYRTDFEMSVDANPIEFDGKWAKTTVYAGISFFYVDSDEPSGMGDEFDVIFYCHDGNWLIYDVLIYFDSIGQQERLDFDAEKEIAEYVAIHEGNS